MCILHMVCIVHTSIEGRGGGEEESCWIVGWSDWNAS